MKSIFVTTLLFMVSLGAQAQDRMVRCQTTSKGYRFDQSSRQSYFSRSEALRKCQAASYTNSQECAVNLVCDNEYSRPSVRCQTTSKGYSFEQLSLQRSFSRQEALRKCQAASYTNSQECLVNLVCDGEIQAEQVRCQTTSKGYSFEQSSRQRYFSRSEAISKCQSASYTNSQECLVNIACNDEPQPSQIRCQTISKGYSFEQSSLGLSFSRSEALRKCQSASYTNSQECLVNLSCDGRGGFRPRFEDRQSRYDTDRSPRMSRCEGQLICRR